MAYIIIDFNTTVIVDKHFVCVCVWEVQKYV